MQPDGFCEQHQNQPIPVAGVRGRSAHEAVFAWDLALKLPPRHLQHALRHLLRIRHASYVSLVASDLLH